MNLLPSARTFAAYLVAPVVVATSFVAVENREALNNRAHQMVPDSCLVNEAALAKCKFGPGF